MTSGRTTSKAIAGAPRTLVTKLPSPSTAQVTLPRTKAAATGNGSAAAFASPFVLNAGESPASSLTTRCTISRLGSCGSAKTMTIPLSISPTSTGWTIASDPAG